MAADIAPPEMDLEMKRTVRLSGPFSATPKKGAGRRGARLSPRAPPLTAPPPPRIPPSAPLPLSARAGR